MAETETKDVKAAARQLVDSLPDDATWDDVMYGITSCITGVYSESETTTCSSVGAWPLFGWFAA